MKLLGAKDISPNGGSNLFTQKSETLKSMRASQAGGKGFEPLSADPESVVLPLDEPPINFQRAVFYHAGRGSSRVLPYPAIIYIKNNIRARNILV
jgi:hypothetical protein